MTRPCGRCGGKGKVRGFEHVHGGVCFACRGTGTRGGKLPEPGKVECSCDACGARAEATVYSAQRRGGPPKGPPPVPVGWTLFRSLSGERELLCGACQARRVA